MRLEQELPEVELLRVPAEGELPPELQGEVLLTQSRAVPQLANLLSRGVRWVHIVSTGIDGFPLELVRADQTVTCSRGARALPISEWVLAMMLAFEKRLPEAWTHEPPQRWAFSDAGELGTLHGRTLGIIGFGTIGQEIAKRALPFGMRVQAVRRHDRPSELPGVEIVRALDALLPEADHLVVAAPATAATHHLLNGETLARLKPGVHLVNVARGSLIDQGALRVALDEERIAVASLDTVEPEPLPAGHWLYEHARVRLSPHISWSTPRGRNAILDAFIDNLRRYMRDEPLEGLVDLHEGY